MCTVPSYSVLPPTSLTSPSVQLEYFDEGTERGEEIKNERMQQFIIPGHISEAKLNLEQAGVLLSITQSIKLVSFPVQLSPDKTGIILESPLLEVDKAMAPLETVNNYILFSKIIGLP